MDNVTHAFVGAAIAECGVPSETSARVRTAFMCAGIVAANAPDIDVFYTAGMEAPIGYLLHHRGHSHTIPGLAVLGILIYSSLRLLPATRSVTREWAPRAVAVIGAALLSHLLLDAANSYGTHLFYPLSSRWVYGDAVFVLEPWLWAILGATVAMNAGRLWRTVSALITLVLIGVLVRLALLDLDVAAVMLVVVVVAMFLMRRVTRRRRATAALVAIATIALVMSGVSRIAKAEARELVTRLDAGEVIDIVSDANPGAPWCWTVLTLQHSAREPGRLIARRGTLSLVPGIRPALSCVSARLGTHWSSGSFISDAVAWRYEWLIDVEQLRTLAATNCHVSAWLQFGRVPHVANGSIADLRFENPIGQNFTPMTIAGGAEDCPAYMTRWVWPRRDVLGQPSDRP